MYSKDRDVGQADGDRKVLTRHEWIANP